MQSTTMFDAISKIDEDLIVTCIAYNATNQHSPTEVKKKRLRRSIKTASVAVAVSLAVAMFTYLITRELNNVYGTIMPQSEIISGSGIKLLAVGVSSSDVYIESLSAFSPNQPDSEKAQYRFYNPTKENTKYIGLWVGVISNCAFLFDENGNFSVYIVKSENALSFAGEGYYYIENNTLQVYLVDESAYGEAAISFTGEQLGLTSEGDDTVFFIRAELSDYTLSEGENKTGIEAFDFRNHTWHIVDGSIDLSFGNDYYCKVYDYSTGISYETHYEWNSTDNTVMFKDWQEGSDRYYLGYITEEKLIIQSGDSYYVFVVEDPTIPKGELQTGILYSGLHEKTDEGWFVLKFEDNGKFYVTIADGNGNLFTERFYYEGTYEYDGTAPLGDDGMVHQEDTGSSSIRMYPMSTTLYPQKHESEIIQLLSLLDSAGMLENGAKLWIEDNYIIIEFDPNPNAENRVVISITLYPLQYILDVNSDSAND